MQTTYALLLAGLTEYGRMSIAEADGQWQVENRDEGYTLQTPVPTMTANSLKALDSIVRQ